LHENHKIDAQEAKKMKKEETKSSLSAGASRLRFMREVTLNKKGVLNIPADKKIKPSSSSPTGCALFPVQVRLWCSKME
jgi:hypothetical protein